MNGTAEVEKQANGISADEVALYDRQIRLWGMEAQERMRSAHVLLISMRALANEVAKNLILAGIGTLTVLDSQSVTEDDLEGQFLVFNEDIGRNRAQAAANNAQKLNPRVSVLVDQGSVQDKSEDFFAGFDVVIACDLELSDIVRINNACRQAHKPFYAAEIPGMTGYVFADLVEHNFVTEREEVSSKGERQKVPIPATERYTSFEEVLKHDYGSTLRPKQKKKVAAVLPLTLALLRYRQREGKSPEKDDNSFQKYVSDALEGLGLPETLISEVQAQEYVQGCDCELSAVAAIVGGVLSQDVLNVLSRRFWRDNRSYIISDEEDAAYGRHNISSRKLKKKRKETKNILLVKNRKEIVKQSCIQIRLPYDILRIVLDFLDPVSLAQCAQVCQEWNIILQHDIIWRASLENCFSTSVSIPEHLTNREFIEVCAASICGLCHERKTGHIKSYFIFGFAACDPCFKENTVCAITARKMILEEDLPLDLVQTVPHENIQVGRAPVWQSTMESRFWPADLKSIIEESFYYHNLDELRAWIQHRADSSASLMKAIKPLRMFQQSYHSEVARIKRDLSNYKLRSKWLQIDNLAQGIGISEERQSWIYKCDYLSRPLMTPVPFTETELRQIARDLPNELEKAEMESKKQSLLRRAEKELKNIITRTISRTSFAYPRMLFKPFERPLPSTELIQLYKRELLELDYLVLLHIISAVYEATEFSREISIGQIMDACDVVSDMTKRHPDFRHQFPELTVCHVACRHE
ncbi:putative SUMO activating enzyme [Taphrina deformans PYCC 5710]|uniref:Ubiquitin-like 1-activating enzyme E1A n=1 Tax=Taphrina deformans (strain PYCC 5710 / ATCC 11124 / CBS 356.35 / IMI 108563 / JCM 9778 / NBRC 8474) TaxID=1097556 RepID=R4XBM0_TAPDE|nr:putative SUMO activating enzyme [Taphrina deformans PYCC 5710]|eukprot:CCG81771.1 putative SUMO activating enzyme [Taphrina deformans PYCC 5710]